MDAIEQATGLRQQAIKVLLDEQERIGGLLLQLGYGQETPPTSKRRGRRPKIATEPDVTVTDALLVEKVDE
jgi:hypothetical protein